MKTFKGFIKEASGFPTGPVGENPNNLAGEVTDTLGSDVFNPDNLKRINAINSIYTKSGQTSTLSSGSLYSFGFNPCSILSSF